MYDHFNTLLGQESENFADNTDLGDIQDDDLNEEITEQENQSSFFSRKNGKSCGPDDLSTELIKTSFDITRYIAIFSLNFQQFI